MILKLIFGGHWKTVEDGWDIVPKSAQDIRDHLRYADNSVEAVFVEHVIEHLDYTDAVRFFRECHRILNPGGVIRIVTPDIMKIMDFRLKTMPDEEYVCRHFGMVPVVYRDFINIFLLNDIMRRYEHEFLWSRDLLIHELSLAGFDAKATEPGSTEHSIERLHRGIEIVKDLPFYDCESCHIEGVKR